MAVDPLDDCTFWYMNEYYETSSAISWSTRIASFKFPGCGPPTAVKVLRFDARRRGRTVRVSWSAGSEADAAGYAVYRSAGSRPFRRLNRALILAGAGSYRLVDPDVRRGRAYTYRLQIVDRSGRRSWYPVGSAA
jgi:hypothetical protein